MRRIRVPTGRAGPAALASLATAMLVVNLAGCSSGPPAPSITVLAAASLQQTFTEIATRFESDHPGAAVDLDFGGSSELATQLTQGADADVFASANTTQMDKVGAAGLLAEEPVSFARNTLVIVTAPGNPHRVESFADLARPGLTVVTCQQPVPCGAATRAIEDSTRVRLNPVSEEPDVIDVLTKVTGGQADAGVVYRTDAINAGAKVTAIDFPQATEAPGAVNTYPIAVLKGASQSGLAQQFVDLVTGQIGQQILAKAGFQTGPAGR